MSDSHSKKRSRSSEGSRDGDYRRRRDRDYRRDDDDDEEEDGVYHNNRSSKRHRGDDNKSNFQLEREQRMARLRQEMKEEDMELAALDQAADAGASAAATPSNPQEELVEVNPEELEDLDEDEQMMKLMGIQGFGSTKGQAVKDNQNSAARGAAAKNKARKYRQYMNRKNGFNRPLEKMN